MYHLAGEQHAQLLAGPLLAVARGRRGRRLSRLEPDRRLSLLGQPNGQNRAAGAEDAAHSLELPLFVGKIAHKDARLGFGSGADGQVDRD